MWPVFVSAGDIPENRYLSSLDAFRCTVKDRQVLPDMVLLSLTAIICFSMTASC